MRRILVMKVLQILFILFSLLFITCENDTSPLAEQLDLILPPDKSLAVVEILDEQNIQTLHFTKWDSIFVGNGNAEKYFLTWEVFLDAQHIRTVQFSAEGNPWIVTVIDIEKWENWQYSYSVNEYTIPIYSDLFIAFELAVKGWVTSRLLSDVYRIEKDEFNQNQCQVNIDEKNNKEWIWLEHCLPIKWEMKNIQSGLQQYVFSELRNVEVNQTFPDSLFIRP